MNTRAPSIAVAAGNRCRRSGAWNCLLKDQRHRPVTTHPAERKPSAGETPRRMMRRFGWSVQREPKKQDRNTAFDAPDARGIMVCMRSGRTDYKRGMNPGTVRRRARSKKFFLLHMLCYGSRRGGNALRQVSRTSRGRRAPLHGGVAHAHICFVDDGTPGGCTLEEKCALRSCLMSIHALAWMSISAPFEGEQVDTVFEGRSGYPDLTTEGEDMTNDSRSGIKDHSVVSHEEWLSARTAFLAKEKEFTRLRDELSQQRRALPWEKVEKQYVFDGAGGKETLADLFENRSQLVVYHFMFPPEDDEGCPSCSFWADTFNGSSIHLPHRDVSFVAISRAPLAKIEPFKQRMGWSFKWVSSFNTDFNFDYYVSFTPEEAHNRTAFYNYARTDPGSMDREGISVFYKDESGAVFHTYSCYARGIDMMNVTYQYLDLTPRGRDEDGLEWVQAWVRHHDRYKD